MSGDPVVFLDRDGVINRRIIDGYVRHEGEFELLAGAVEAMSCLSRAGFRLAVVTNQRGIALGLMNLEDVAHIHGIISRAVAAAGGHLDEFYVCPHDRDSGCPCRKPLPGLLDQAHAGAPVDWSSSFLVGDSDTDILAGKARGVTTIKVAGPSAVDPDHLAVDLPAAAALIVDPSRRPC